MKFALVKHSSTRDEPFMLIAEDMAYSWHSTAKMPSSEKAFRLVADNDATNTFEEWLAEAPTNPNYASYELFNSFDDILDTYPELFI